MEDYVHLGLIFHPGWLKKINIGNVMVVKFKS